MTKVTLQSKGWLFPTDTGLFPGRVITEDIQDDAAANILDDAGGVIQAALQLYPASSIATVGTLSTALRNLEFLLSTATQLSSLSSVLRMATGPFMRSTLSQSTTLVSNLDPGTPDSTDVFTGDTPTTTGADYFTGDTPTITGADMFTASTTSVATDFFSGDE